MFVGECDCYERLSRPFWLKDRELFFRSNFGNLLSRVQEEKFAERRVDKVNIDNGKIFLVT